MNKVSISTFNNGAVALAQISQQCEMTVGGLLDEAVNLLLWAIHEKLDGRRICSVEAETIVDNCLIETFVEGSSGYLYETPLLSKIVGERYLDPQLIDDDA